MVVPTDTRHNMTVCRVENDDVDVDAYLESNQDIRWIITRVDSGLHQKCLSMEEDAVRVIRSAEKRRKREELKKSILADLKGDELVALPIYSQHESD